MPDHRVKKKEKNCIQKIEKYVTTFLHNLHKKCNQSLSLNDKIELYRILKSEEDSNSEQHNFTQLLLDFASNIEKQTE